MRMKYLFLVASLLALGFSTQAQKSQKLVIDGKKPIATVSPTMWGIFFEDINFAADGGIYAELVKNRSFEFRNPMQGWAPYHLNADKGEIFTINRENAGQKNPRYLHIAKTGSTERFGIVNEGFRGMGFKEGESYHFYIMAKKNTNDLKLHVELLDTLSQVIGSAVLQGFGNDWKEYEVSLTASKTVEKGKMRVSFEGDGAIDIDMISLFPAKTWKNRPKGLRADLIDLLDGLKPSFVRFPGGCIVEGYELENRYQWKNTVGPIEDRTVIKSRWNDEFAHRPAPDYFQSYGIGYYEYFLLSEDLGAEPLPIMNCGMACQFNTKEVASLDDVQSYIQDVLDLIEFANGGADTHWGKLRVEMGHPKPFNLKYIGIGNEQWGPQYIERYKLFHKVLKEKYPEIQLISASGPGPDERSEYLWAELKKINADIVDEHYYRDPKWFLENANRYDTFDPKGPKVFAGEYACHTNGNEKPESRNNWESAMCEAAFMTGLERNADVVTMTAYAPLFAHKNAWQWNPDLIWFDNLTAIPTANYRVQQLYSLYRGTRVLPITANGKDLIGQNQIYASVTIDDKAQMLYVKLVNTATEKQTVSLQYKGLKVDAKATAEMLSLSKDLKLYNAIGGSEQFEPQSTQVKSINELSLEANSFNILKIKLK